MMMLLWGLLAALVALGLLMGAIALTAVMLDRAIEKAKRGSDDVDQ